MTGCTLCGAEGLSTEADFAVQPAAGGDMIVSCARHLGESAVLVMRDSGTDKAAVYALTGR